MFHNIASLNLLAKLDFGKTLYFHFLCDQAHLWEFVHSRWNSCFYHVVKACFDHQCANCIFHVWKLYLYVHHSGKTKISHYVIIFLRFIEWKIIFLSFSFLVSQSHSHLPGHFPNRLVNVLFYSVRKPRWDCTCQNIHNWEWV